jgi:hypothetical protein
MMGMKQATLVMQEETIWQPVKSFPPAWQRWAGKTGFLNLTIVSKKRQIDNHQLIKFTDYRSL